MKKILFMIHDLEHGGAEKVLVNLVNNLDNSKFDITVMTLFDVGINRQFLNSYITYKSCFKKVFPANSHLMKLLTPTQLHKLFIKEKYDIEIAYLEGPCARIISGCPNKNTKLVSWIHIELHTKKAVASSFRNYSEALNCYNKFNKIICVSQDVMNDFTSLIDCQNTVDVLYNTNETNDIIEKSKKPIHDNRLHSNSIKLIGVGKLLKNKGFDRLVKIIFRLIQEGYNVQLFILGIGPLQEELEQFIIDNNMTEHIFLLGYDTNPYKYVSACNLFVCSSLREGFSTAATEALIVGTPVCTVNVSGMKEMLGNNNQYGLVVENTDEALYEGIKKLLDDPELLAYYKQKAIERGKIFTTENTVKAAEEMLLTL